MQNIGKYQVLKVLGQGGMGVVYLARDPGIERRVALKVMAAALAADARLRERFVREARAAGNLVHPNIVTIFELGEDSGSPFIAMEYLEGRPLHETALSTGQKLRLFVELCEALEYAHSKGVIHRDVKPANVIVLPNGMPKLVDFGIARVAGTRLTQTGALLGTVAYMSPEQIRGREVDKRSDVFSAGVLLYELLSGRLPFEGESAAETMMKILEAEPAPLRLDGAPPALTAVVATALAKDPACRAQSAAELADDVRRCLPRTVDLPATVVVAGGTAAVAAQAMVASPRPTPVRAAPISKLKEWRGRRWLRAAGALVLVGALLVPLRLASTPLPWKKEVAYLALRTRAALGSGEANYQLAESYRDAELRAHVADDSKPLHWARVAAEKGDARAQYLYGRWLTGGTFGPADKPAGEGWIRRAAEQGYPQAEFEYGEIVAARGDGDGALAWWERAAASGHVEAMTHLALRYQHGKGTPDELRKAIALWERAGTAEASAERRRTYGESATRLRNELASLGTIEGVLGADIEGEYVKPYPDVRVELLSPSGAVITSAVSDAQGRFAFNEVRAGNYKLRFRAPGCPREHTRSLTILGGIHKIGPLDDASSACLAARIGL